MLFKPLPRLGFLDLIKSFQTLSLISVNLVLIFLHYVPTFLKNIRPALILIMVLKLEFFKGFAFTNQLSWILYDCTIHYV